MPEFYKFYFVGREEYTELHQMKTILTMESIDREAKCFLDIFILLLCLVLPNARESVRQTGCQSAAL